ncbi:carnitine O-acetyltransferase yat1 [Yamadazyma tenuis]|uniref:Choline/carnitine acyltransferase domain-containing protein n=1 Tax=Candida tenuis (strain ATCC 10573 / BCRC 21748 / CBS 615 / JCM 9827 / NBRC 10315 / NRRL Y-1498 / VKM Y-70) TaxID=590646 RepID=G3BDA1_CANTC|nr:uncharacterized protein CANTEDRAFT_110734 [Yamadazyma tenuis ATCC 10573]EGV60279.1 hypothetical protein CANTEDRAFT_110734 [Yamadazyma tenuis ATCC 10573]WEJ94478.1 carnitine O-acetyltransferase yat1 [Yamadazyma tenuis]
MTYQYQDQLQKLPIPDLHQTCTNYLRVLKPLQTEKEYEKTMEAVAKFLKSGTGKYLDEQLREYSKNRNSYIEQFWYDSYLNYDSPVVLNLNPFFLLEDDPFNNESNSINPQVKRAASLTLSSLKFIRALKNETLPPDRLKNDQVLDMYQYSKLFGSARIPTDEGCVMQSDQNSNHIVVLSKSQFYWFDVLNGNNDLILSESDLIINFNSIIKDSLDTNADAVAKSSFGILTTENRRVWAKLRNTNLSNNSSNREILSIIDSALFILCLDDIKLYDLSDLAKNMLCGLSILDRGVQVGTCTNRWYDKLQIIITQNGKAGINFEHTGVDGHTVLRFVSDIYTDSILSFAHQINANSPNLWGDEGKKASIDNSENLITIPRKLEWDLTPDLSLALRFAETRLSDLINQNEFKHLEFKNYGSSTIKNMKFSPDAFIQMAFQATYYALYGKVECTYEPAMTKQFLHGRTEAIRPVSQESNLFVRKFFDSSVPNKTKLEFLSIACQSHSKQTRLASNGEGVDRHLFALFCIWKRYIEDEANEANENDDSNSDRTLGNEIQFTGPDKSSLQEIPSLFADSGWDKLNNTILSTSNCGNPSLRLFGFGPVSANGFGIGYIIKDDSVSICASSKHRQTSRFLATLESYLNEIYRIFKEVNSPTNEFLSSPVETKHTHSPASTPIYIENPKPAAYNGLSNLLGGYGYFDMGDDDIKSRGPSPEPPFLNRHNSGFSIKEIGKKLRLSEY